MGIYIYKLLNGEWFWGLRAMIGEAMMKFFGSRTMRVSAIGIFLGHLHKNYYVRLTTGIREPVKILQHPSVCKRKPAS